MTLIACVITALLIGGGTATASSLITGAKIKDNSITGKDIKNRSIKLADLGFYNGDGAGDVFTVDSPELTLPPGADIVDVAGNAGLTARCPSGTRVVGTGFNSSVGVASFVKSYELFV